MYKVFDLQTFSDAKGKLTPIEFSKLNLFEIKRVYTVFDNLMSRGGHAHIVEEEFFFMAKGECLAKIHDGKDWREVPLKEGENAIYIGKMVWHEFNDFSDGAVLVALSSTNYNPSREDYIEDINKFLNV
jgi:dTDP-4-dehydrorhamnose 3,5-epimerase-like enzyme